MDSKVKVAIVHDWYVASGGAEKVVKQIIDLYPHADLFSVVDFFNEEQRSEYLQGKRVTTTFIQKLPFAKSKYRNYLSLMPFAIEQLDLTSYDLVISSSHAVAKGVITGPDQTHICYCHSPIRYAWDLKFQYLKETGLDSGLKAWIAKKMLYKIRQWDLSTVNGVDYFIANSNFIKSRVWKAYRREAEVIYPNVEVEDFDLVKTKKDYYFTASRMVPYKKLDLIVKAFSKMPDKKLIVIGDGPDMAKIMKVKTNNIEILGYQTFDVLKEHLQNAKAFVFAAEEDFGIIPVEAQACGTPVICYGKGGLLETVENNKTGIHFDQQTELSIIDAVTRFESNYDTFDGEYIRNHSSKFSTEVFKQKFKRFVDDKMKARV